MSESQDSGIRWVSAFETGLEYEADIVRDRLDDAEIPAVVFTQRDHMFNLTIGNLSPIHVMVPLDRLADALAILEREPLKGSELDEASDRADPRSPSKHSEDVDSLLDSSIERIRFVSPEQPDENEDVA